MTNKEWNEGIEFLEKADFGEWVEHEGRQVFVDDMCGGRYVCFDENNELVGLTFEVWKAMTFLRFGKWE